MDLTNVWLNREEEIIHECLEETFDKRGYRVINLHKIDRRREDGADLDISNPDEKIYIQAKIKPLKKDIKQLHRLSKLKADKRIYVYVENPAVAFKEEQEKVKNVEFWNKEKLHGVLLENNSTVYFRLLVLASPMVRDIVKTLETINSCHNTHASDLGDNGQISWWLVLKDRAVKLHASLELIYEWYKTELLMKDKNDESETKYYLKSLLILFDKISQNSSKDLNSIAEEIKTKYPHLLSKYVKVTGMRSNWIGMPYGIKDNLTERIEEWILPHESTDNTFFNLANFYLKNLKDIAKAIEDGVDWIFENKFNVRIAHV